MTALSQERIATLVAPYDPSVTPLLLQQLSTYLELLLKWNERMNLSAIREPEEIVRRHFGESLFLARHLPEGAETLLDLGSGAGFPGLPVQLVRPALRVTLAESQSKKASFLREVLRTLQLPAEVWPNRAESLPADRLFDVVTLRAVDRPELALLLARQRLRSGGVIAHLTSERVGREASGIFPLPGAESSSLHLLR